MLGSGIVGDDLQLGEAWECNLPEFDVTVGLDDDNTRVQMWQAGKEDLVRKQEQEVVRHLEDTVTCNAPYVSKMSVRGQVPILWYIFVVVDERGYHGC